MLQVLDPAALQAASGTDLGHSEWVRIDQSSIDGFAELTGDLAFSSAACLLSSMA